MKILKLIAGVVGLLFVVALYAVLAPTHGRSLGVSITPRGFQTNTAGQAVPLYAISNNSSRSVLVIPVIERRPPPQQVIDMLGHTQRVLAARSEILVLLSNTPPERAAVHCQRERYVHDTKGIAKRMFDTYLFCRRENEIVYP